MKASDIMTQETLWACHEDAPVRQAARLMAEGVLLVWRVRGRMGWELRLVVQGGLRILERIAAMQYRSLSMRPTLGAWDWFVMLWRAARMRPHPMATGLRAV